MRNCVSLYDLIWLYNKIDFQNTDVKKYQIVFVKIGGNYKFVCFS